MEEIFNQMELEINNEFTKLSKLISSDSRGHARESIIIKFFKNLLPNSFGITRGKVISSDGQESDEIDIIIYDLIKTPILYKVGDYSLVPIIRTIQKIKKMNKKSFYEQSGDIVKKVLAYGKEFEYFPTLGMIFSFDSISIEELGNFCESVYEKEKIILEEQADFICIFNKGLIYHSEPPNFGRIQIYPTNKCKITVKPQTIKSHNLKNFFLGLNHILVQAWTRPIRLSDYFQKTKELG